MTYVLWILQALLALLFVFAGGCKLVMPPDQLISFAPLPVLVLRAVGVAELLGGLGLVLPGLLRIRPSLTPLAAAELAHVMLAATLITLATDGAALALVPLAVGVLCGVVACARWRIAPQHSRSHAFELEPAGIPAAS